VNPYEEPSTPDLNDLQQNNEREAPIEVPVRVVDIGSVQVHTLPARDATMRAIVVDDNVQQIVGGNLRRQRITVWATAIGANSNFIYMGTDKNQVETNNAAQLPAMVNTYADGPPVVVTMTHAMPIWVKAPIDVQCTLSVITEDWAD